MGEKPEVQVQLMDMPDPTFEAGSTHVATARITNPTNVGWTYNVELYLGVNKVATSGAANIAVPANSFQDVDFTITVPAVEGQYPVFIDVKVAGDLIAHYQGTEDVFTEISPAVDVDIISWE